MRNNAFVLLATILFTCGNTIKERKIENTGNKIESFDIAFEDEYGLCAANLKTGKKTLVDPHGKYGCISKDGKQIVYTKEDKIYIMDFSTRAAHLINTGWDHNYSPIWSPDNKQIAFYAYAHLECFIGVTGKDNKGVTTIAKTKDSFSGPVWAPDGKAVIFSDRTTIYQ